MIGTVKNKIRTFLALVKEGQFSEIIQIATGKVVRVIKYRLDKIDVDDYQFNRFKTMIPLRLEIATPTKMQHLFENWPDSLEEYKRHFQVYFEWGFKTCFLAYCDDTNEVAHFQFLIRYKDYRNVKKSLPRIPYNLLVSKSYAFSEWVYTFEKYRRLGITGQAMDFTIKFCQNMGIKTLFSHRGIKNIASIKMADKVGFITIATIYQVQFFNQKKHSGYYYVKWRQGSILLSE
jgi:GNAT superfamily N-acetyltransferase